jgi:isoleucyl-tRNA synthetase
MSKKLKNYRDPIETINQYGADAIRYYLLSSQLIRGEDLNFSQRSLDEINKKFLLRLENVFSFYELYKDASVVASGTSDNVLDQWILARLFDMANQVTAGMEAYELDRATRPLMGFVDDLSTWYLRRSRDRLKGDDISDRKKALATMQFVLKEFAKLMAPFMPFFAEYLYLKLKTSDEAESVHLTSWPEQGDRKDDAIIKQMQLVRDTVTLGLEARSSAKIVVRQPLAELKIKNSELKGKDGLLELLKDEVNVKEISFDESLATEVELDTTITPELKAEGDVRELTRGIQELRKQKGLNPSDIITLVIATDATGETLLKKFEPQVKKTVLAKEIQFKENDGTDITVGGVVFKVALA